jgi:hypothetical protein
MKKYEEVKIEGSLKPLKAVKDGPHMTAAGDVDDTDTPGQARYLALADEALGNIVKKK